MVQMWRGRDLPAWEAHYVLRDARLGYLKGYERALVGGALSEVLADRLRRRAPLGREVAREARGCSRKVWVEPAPTSGAKLCHRSALLGPGAKG